MIAMITMMKMIMVMRMMMERKKTYHVLHFPLEAMRLAK